MGSAMPVARESAAAGSQQYEQGLSIEKATYHGVTAPRRLKCMLRARRLVQQAYQQQAAI